jgi:hypothetical protein
MSACSIEPCVSTNGRRLAALCGVFTPVAYIIYGLALCLCPWWVLNDRVFFLLNACRVVQASTLSPGCWGRSLLNKPRCVRIWHICGCTGSSGFVHNETVRHTCLKVLEYASLVYLKSTSSSTLRWNTSLSCKGTSGAGEAVCTASACPENKKKQLTFQVNTFIL